MNRTEAKADFKARIQNFNGPLIITDETERKIWVLTSAGEIEFLFRADGSISSSLYEDGQPVDTVAHTDAADAFAAIAA